VTNPNSPDPVNYLNFSYSTQTDSGTITSTRDMTMSANPLRLSGDIRYSGITALTSSYDKLVLDPTTFRARRQTNYYANAFKTVSQNISANTQTVVTFTTGAGVTVSTYGITFNSTNNSFVFNTTGLFAITYRIQPSTGTITHVFMYLRDVTTNTVINGSCVGVNVGTSFTWQANNTFYLSVTPTSEISLGCSGVGAFNITTTAISSNSPPVATTAAAISIMQIE
jgi:hypothetical protein